MNNIAKHPKDNAALKEVTPRTVLRGWFHTGYAPFVLASGIVLLCLTASAGKSAQIILSVIAFMVCSTLLFTMSAIYNVFNWKPKVKSVLRRIDHVNIFLIIAGTYTPLAVAALPWESPSPIGSGMVLLLLIWISTIIGLVLHVIWISAPRVLYTVIYIVLGLSALIYLPAIVSYAMPLAVPVVVLIASGGLCYIVGAVFYALKWPGRNARVFGFHELFHIFTVLAFACHTVAIYFAVLYA